MQDLPHRAQKKVQLTDGHVHALDSMDAFDQPMGQMNAACPDSNQCQICHTLVMFQNFMGDTSQGTGDVAGVHATAAVQVAEAELRGHADGQEVDRPAVAAVAALVAFLVVTTPWIDAKYYAAAQVMDEARHVEVFAKYLNTKLGGAYPVNANLQMLIDDILGDSRWDMTYMGMQIMIEGLALAAFGFMHQITQEPLLKNLLRYVMSDEARHVAFGVLSLQEFYAGLSGTEIRERQEFAFEAALRMRDRMQGQEVWDRMGVSRRDAAQVTLLDPDRVVFQAALFSKIVPNCKKLGLLDAGDGWLRTKFTEMGVIAFEDWEDTTLDADANAEGSPVGRD